MSLKRRHFLMFLGAATGSIAIPPVLASNKKYPLALAEETIASNTAKNLTKLANHLNFTPIKTSIPLGIENITPQAQIEAYSTYDVRDELSLPEEFTYDLIAAWGDRLGDSRFGYNNDYLSLVETATNEGFLTVNFEYISGATWMETYPLVIGKELPLAEVKTQIQTEGQEDEIDAFSLGDSNLLKAQIQEISREGLIDQGMGVISLRRNSEGKWERTYSEVDRRITGISGLDNPSQSLKSTGAAVAVFTKKNKLGYEDGLGDRIIGTFQNCAGGTTPWGTVMSAEENIQDQVPEEVMADGSSFSPSAKPFILNDREVDGRANVFGLAGNKYGWMVEIDPSNPNDYGTKHTWLGRYRHEAFGLRAEAGKNLAVYSGCDRRGGHLYKFISADIITDPQDKGNSRLLAEGMLYGAKLNPDGTGEWIALNPDTPVNPVSPNQVAGGMVTLPNSDREVGGKIEVTSRSQVEAYQQQFKTLGDLYRGDNTQEQQGAILIDAHFAASAAGVTCTARPEDTIVDDQGALYIAFTSGSSGGDGGPDLAIFKGPDGETPYELGWVMKLEEDNNDPSALNFRWTMLAMGGEPATGGAGFANPDNIAIDKAGNLWIVTDMSTSVQNKALPTRTENGQPLSSKSLTGVFGNNSLWFIPTTGELAGEAYPFAVGPMECECTGPFFSQDSATLFLAVQHPGEKNGIRQDMAVETRDFTLLTTDGRAFNQTRQVPLGSNWPENTSNQPPRPAVVAIRRIDGQKIS
ncbi:MAG: PhoX family phosphatase [Xenococcaceae cyanobacterium]